MLIRNNESLRFWLGISLGLALTVANGVLLWQNVHLKHELADANHRDQRQRELKIGTVLSGLTGVSLKGEPVSVTYRGGQAATVLLVFSPTCPWCERNWPEWQTLARRLAGSRVRTIAASLASVSREWIARGHQLSGTDVVWQLDPRVVVSHNLMLTPQTIVIDAGGRVRGVWTGLLDEERLREVEETLRAVH